MNPADNGRLDDKGSLKRARLNGHRHTPPTPPPPPDALMYSETGTLPTAGPDGSAGPAEPLGLDAVGEAAEAFARELARLRAGRGWPQRRLAELMGYDRSRVSHIENGTEDPSEAFAEAADRALSSGHTLTDLWRAYHIAHTIQRQPSGTRHHHPNIRAADSSPAGAHGGHHANDAGSSDPRPQAPAASNQDAGRPSIAVHRADNAAFQFGNHNTQHIHNPPPPPVPPAGDVP